MIQVNRYVMTEEMASLSIRLDLPTGRIGPGKVRLLGAIASEGSITAAAATMEISYRKALRLVDELNATFSEPLVQTATGGARRGGAELTEAGHAVVRAYAAVTKTAQSAAAPYLADLAAL